MKTFGFIMTIWCIIAAAWCGYDLLQGEDIAFNASFLTVNIICTSCFYNKWRK